MVVTKILESTLAAGVTSVQFTDSDIPNSLIRVFCNDADLLYTSLSLTGNTLTVTYPAQNVNKNIALELVKAGLDIVDNLTTDDATKALSAKQGKALDDKIDELDLEDLYNVSVTEAENGDILIYYGGEWINVPGKNNITDMDDVAVSTIQDGQVLAWDEDAEKFVNVNQSGGGSSVNYSETEQEIGTWIDGSKLYQISVKLDDITIPQSSRVIISLNNYISNLNYIISAELVVIDGSTNITMPAFQVATMATYGMSFFVTKSDGLIISRGSESGTITRDFVATFRYTKTS